MHPLSLLPPYQEVHTYAPDWRMSDDALFQLARVLCRYTPKRIFEVGPGISTAIILAYLDQRPEGHFITVNHQSEWHTRYQSMISRLGFRFNYHDLAFPLREDGWYNTDQFPYGAFGEYYDLVLLDGPISSQARYCDDARKLYRALIDPERTVVIVDDTNREDEQKIVDWLITRGYAADVVTDTVMPHRLTTFCYPGSYGMG
jgi:predicted O-methyltransferase YrrM